MIVKDLTGNLGTATAENGGKLSVWGVFTNAQDLTVHASKLSLGGTWTNTGTITVTSASSLDLGGNWVNNGVINATRENCRAGRMAVLEGAANGYVHFNRKSGAIVALDGADGGSDRTRAFLYDLSMHIVSTPPDYLHESDVPAEILEKEKEIAREKAKKDGKPDQILDKIADGAARKFLNERVFLNQGYFKEPKKKVSDMLAAFNKETGGEAAIKGFARFEIG